MIRNAQRAMRAATGQRKGRLRRAINDLHTVVGRTERVVAQTRSRLAGVMPESASRLVGLHDVDARPIRQRTPGQAGRIRLQSPDRRQRRRGHPRPHHRGRHPRRRPARLVPAIERITTRTGHTPGAVTPTAATASRLSNTTCTSPECVASRSHERVNPVPRAESSNTGEPSATR